MAKSATHNEIMLRPPPGVAFSIWGSDVHLNFERGREREIVTWLHAWIDAYIEPEAQKADADAAQRARDTRMPVTTSGLLRAQGMGEALSLAALKGLRSAPQGVAPAPSEPAPEPPPDRDEHGIPVQRVKVQRIVEDGDELG